MLPRLVTSVFLQMWNRHELQNGVLVVWLDEIRWFLEDMNLTDFVNVPLGRKSRRLPNFAGALPWLLSVAVAKESGLLGGFEDGLEVACGQNREFS